MSEDFEDKFRKCFRAIIGNRALKIEDDEALGADLGIAGQDGWDLKSELTREFNVDWTGFDSYGYFGPEKGFDVLALILLLLSSSSRRRWCERREFSKKLTVGHLRRICMEGRWSEP